MNYLIFGKYKINNRIYKNLKGLLLEFFSRTTIQIFFFPLMFYIWGTEYTGIWIFLTSITTFAALTNLNPDEFIRQHMILNFDNKIEKQKIYSNGFIIALINSLFFFLVVYFVNLIFLDKFTITENINFKDLKTFIFIIAGCALFYISLNKNYDLNALTLFLILCLSSPVLFFDNIEPPNSTGETNNSIVSANEASLLNSGRYFSSTYIAKYDNR